MEKITSILAVVEASATGALVLDKSVALARAFGARVDLLVMDAALFREFTSRCAALVYDEVTICAPSHHARESMQSVVLRRIWERHPDILVKAPASPHPLRSWTLDTNDRELVRESPIPVLLVRDKAWNRPMRLAAAVDVSDADAALVARGILQCSGFLTLGLHGTLDILYTERELGDETLRMERAVRLAQLVREYHVGTERLQMFDGPPETRLPPLVGARQYDVLVIGAVSHREAEMLHETLTSKLFESSASDVLLAKAAEARTGARRRAPSVHKQAPHQAEEFV